MDPIAARSPRLVAFFGHVMGRAMRRRFHAVRLSRAGRPAMPLDRPVIVYTNHPSWWDAAFLIVLARRRFAERPGFGPIDAAALDRYPFMRRIGLFGIERDTARGAGRFLRQSLRILDQPRAMLWLTAEGAFADPRRRPVRLRPGLAHLARRVPRAVIVPLALEYPFWDERTPEALCRFGPPMATDDGLSVAAWRARLEAALTRTMDALAEEAMGRDPGRFEPLLRGTVGVGGVYDLWRRARALAAGRRFTPGHGAPEP